MGRRVMGEGEMDARIRVRMALFSWLMGAVSGLVRGWYGQGSHHLITHALLGLILMLVLTACGGFFGLFARSVQRLFSTKTEPGGEDIAGALALGAAAGSFVGLVVTLSLGKWESVDVGTALGGATGAFLGVMFEDTAVVLVRYLVIDAVAAQMEDEPPKPDRTLEVREDEPSPRRLEVREDEPEKRP